MQAPIISELEYHALEALLTKGPMSVEQLTELCKNAFGWSGAVIRRTQKSLLDQGLVTEQDGILTPTVTKEALEKNNWNLWNTDTFERHSPTQPETAAKQPFFKRLWFWTTCVACAVIAVLCVLLVIGPPAPDTVIPDELAMCKEALDKWQSNKNYCVLQITETFPSLVTVKEERLYQTYWIHEDDWVYLTLDMYDTDTTAHPGYMYRDGQFFVTFNCSNKNWLSSSMEVPPTPEPWPMTFSWTQCELVHLNTTTLRGETTVRFRIIDNSSKPQEVYEVEFMLDGQQNLSAIRTFTIEQDMTVRTDLYGIETTDPDVIAEYIANQGNTKTDIDIAEPVPEPG